VEAKSQRPRYYTPHEVPPLPPPSTSALTISLALSPARTHACQATMQSDTKPRLSYSTNPEQQLSFSTQPFANQRTRAGLTALHARRLLGVAAGQSAQPHTAHQGACGSRRLCPTPPSFQAASTQDVRNKRLEHAREYHPIATPGRTRAAVLSATTSPFLSLAAADVSKSHWFLRVLWDSCAGQRGRAGAAADPQRRPGPVPLVRRCHW